MATSRFCRVAGNCDDAAYVDPDRGQNSPDAKSMDQSLMARDALCDCTRPDHFTDPAWHIDVRDPF